MTQYCAQSFVRVLTKRFFRCIIANRNMKSTQAGAELAAVFYAHLISYKGRWFCAKSDRYSVKKFWGEPLRVAITHTCRAADMLRYRFCPRPLNYRISSRFKTNMGFLLQLRHRPNVAPHEDTSCTARLQRLLSANYLTTMDTSQWILFVTGERCFRKDHHARQSRQLRQLHAEFVLPHS